jgi:predicted ATPase
MFVQRLKIENWKNFRKGEIHLSRRLFLIGPNASGKSNFLDIFRFLRDISLSSGGGLKKAVEDRRGVSAIRCLAAREKPEILIEVELKEDNPEQIWIYRLSFNHRRKNLEVKEEHVELNGKVLLKRPDKDDVKDPLRLTQTALEQINLNKDFREVVNFFQNISYQHLLPQVIRDPQGFSSVPILNDPYGRDFLQRVENTPSNHRESRLNKIQKALKIAVPQLNELKVERDKFGVPHLIGLFEHWRPNAGKQNEFQFSDGTLRLFGLLWSFFEGDGMLLLEEPELSLHSEVVRQFPAMIEKINKSRKVKSRQVIISTYSEEMLSDEGIGGEEVIRLEPSENGTLLKSVSLEEKQQLESGLTVADVMIPKTKPQNVQQLELVF